MNRYQDVYPSPPILRSEDEVPPRAADLVRLEYFEAEPARMPTEAFGQHHVLINLKAEPHRVENWRGGEYRDFVYRQHEVVVTPAGLASGWRWHARSKVIVVTIEPEPLARFAERELGVLLSERQLVDEAQRHDPDLCAAAEQLHGALLADAATRGVLYEALARVFVVKLLSGYGERRTEPLDPASELGTKRYKRVLDCVAERYGRALTVEDMARAAGMSSSAFAHAFKAALGDTPHQFLTRYQVERAQAMLREGDAALIDVALACGFSDQSHLGRVFKRVAGVTPTAYRRRLSGG